MTSWGKAPGQFRTIDGVNDCRCDDRRDGGCYGNNWVTECKAAPTVAVGLEGRIYGFCDQCALRLLTHVPHALVPESAGMHSTAISAAAALARASIALRIAGRLT